MISHGYFAAANSFLNAFLPRINLILARIFVLVATELQSKFASQSMLRPNQ